MLGLQSLSDGMVGCPESEMKTQTEEYPESEPDDEDPVSDSDDEDPDSWVGWRMCPDTDPDAGTYLSICLPGAFRGYTCK